MRTGIPAGCVLDDRIGDLFRRLYLAVDQSEIELMIAFEQSG